MTATYVDRDPLEVAERLLEVAQSEGAGQAEACVRMRSASVARFASSEVHQHGSEMRATVALRVSIPGGGSSWAYGENLAPEALRQTTKDAISAARASRATEPIRLAVQSSREQRGEQGPRTADASSRVSLARDAIEAARSEGTAASGSVETAIESCSVSNTNGVRVTWAQQSARMTVVAATGRGGTGYSEGYAADIGKIDAASLGSTASQKALAADEPVEVKPGPYMVVLEENAVADVLDMLGPAFSARAVDEGESFFQEGKQVGSDLIDLWDDGSDPGGVPIPYDWEGTPKSRVDLVRKGICGAVMLDCDTASKRRASSTGHAASPFDEAEGPQGQNLFMGPGAHERSSLVDELESGILITRFHYTNQVSLRLGIVTGMTRDGTFLVRNGKIARAVKNMRFTHSYLDVLRNADALSSSRRCVRSGWTTRGEGARVVPALRTREFRFVGVTG